MKSNVTPKATTEPAQGATGYDITDGSCPDCGNPSISIVDEQRTVPLRCCNCSLQSAFARQQAVVAPQKAEPSDAALEELKDRVLNTVYHKARFKRLKGHSLLAARHTALNVGIFVVNGHFGPDQFKRAIAEAKAVGLRTPRMYVYAESTTYSRADISFCKFDEIGIVT